METYDVMIEGPCYNRITLHGVGEADLEVLIRLTSMNGCKITIGDVVQPEEEEDE